MAIDIAAFTDLDAVAADARGALDRARQPCLFDRLDWYRLMIRHCPPPGTPLIVRARDKEGALWLFLSRQSRHAAALANWYSFEAGPIVEGSASTELFEALGRYLRIDQRLSRLNLAPLPEERLTMMAKPFRAAGWSCFSSEATTNWTITIPGTTWSQYIANRPRRLQNTLKRKMKANVLEIKIFDIFSNDAWRSFESVYASSWKPEEGSPAFLRALAEQEGLAGTLRLGLAFEGDTPIAAQFWLVENAEATIHKLAHVEATRGQSPGTLLTAAMFRHAIEQDRVRRIDFGLGDDPYKADWMDHPRPLYRLSLFDPRTAVGLIGAARESLSAARATIRRAGTTRKRGWHE